MAARRDGIPCRLSSVSRYPEEGLVSTESGTDVLLRYGVGKEGGVTGLREEGSFEGGALGRIVESGLGSLDCGAERVLREDIVGVGGLRGIQKVYAELLFLAGTTLEVERFGTVEFATYAGKHTMKSDFCHKVKV